MKCQVPGQVGRGEGRAMMQGAVEKGSFARAAAGAPLGAMHNHGREIGTGSECQGAAALADGQE